MEVIGIGWDFSYEKLFDISNLVSGIMKKLLFPLTLNRKFYLLKDFIKYVRNFRRLSYLVKVSTVSLKDMEYFLYNSHGNGMGSLGNWCLKNCYSRFEMIDHNIWMFSSESDAMAFKLRYGDNQNDSSQR